MEEKNENISVINKELRITEYTKENIKNLIYNVRGKQVMLDSDVAMLYHYSTKRVNETVRRNKNRFPENFCFQLREEETENLRSQFATSSLKKENYGGRRTLPYVFTEQGIAMLSGLLRNEIAIQVSINIMNAFVEMRRFLTTNRQVFERLNNVEYKLIEQNDLLSNHEKKFEEVFDQLQNKKENEFTQKIFFDGQIWDSYSFAINKMNDIKSIEGIENTVNL